MIGRSSIIIINKKIKPKSQFIPSPIKPPLDIPDIISAISNTYSHHCLFILKYYFLIQELRTLSCSQ